MSIVFKGIFRYFYLFNFANPWQGHRNSVSQLLRARPKGLTTTPPGTPCPTWYWSRYCAHILKNMVEPCQVNYLLNILVPFLVNFWELQQITTATKTSPNKRFHEQKNGCVRALLIFVYFVAVLSKTTT